MQDTRFPIVQLWRFTFDVFQRLGCNPINSAQAADVLSESDKRGIDSHGIARLHNYVHWLKNDYAPANPVVEVVRESGAIAVVDGGGGLGIMVAAQANGICIQKAAEVGTAWVSMRNSNHFGIAGFYTAMAAEQEMVGWAMSNATAQVAPAGSADPMFGTNPFSVAIPYPGHFPIVVDMATSAVAYGKIEIAKRKGEPIPLGWAMNDRGENTTDPYEIGESKPYSMLPIGSVPEHGLHKGYCMVALTDLLSGVLGDAAFGPFGPHFMKPENSPVSPFGNGLGHLFGAFQVNAFSDMDSYALRVQKWVETIKSAKPIDPETPVMIPGEPEFIALNDRSKNGVPLNRAVVQSLQEISRDLDVKLE